MVKKWIISLIPAIFCGILMTNCNTRTSTVEEVAFVSADSLVVNVDDFVGKEVQTEGYISHVCGVDGMKMKLKSDNGRVMVIVPADTARFDPSINKKRIKVSGIVQETRLTPQYINEKEAEKAVLCHLDETPCKDTAWINGLIRSGEADTISKKCARTLRNVLTEQGKGYVSIVTIVCKKYEVVDED
ncbi:MAG: hypothetical protein PHR20_00330 [Bacteroidales bacterium]|nr:hypothetical protein [Bacteroidales bacterium]